MEALLAIVAKAVSYQVHIRCMNVNRKIQWKAAAAKTYRKEVLKEPGVGLPSGESRELLV